MGLMDEVTVTRDYLGLVNDVSTVFTEATKTRRVRHELAIWRTLIFGIGGTVVCILGILCNIAAVLVLAKFKTASSAPFLLVCLACLDTCYLFFMMVFENLTIISNGRVISRDYLMATLPYYKYFYAIPLVAQTCISYTILLISVERFIVVAWPFKAFVICSKKIAAFAMACILIFGIVFHVPTYLAYDNSYIWQNSTQSYQLKFSSTPFGNSYFYIEIFSKWILMAVNFIIPFLLLVAVNINLLRVLRKSRSPAGAMNGVNSEYRLTIMVFCMTAIFFLFEILEASSFVLTAGIYSYSQSPKIVQRFTACADLITEINSALNFLIYCASGRKFRDMFCRVFFPCLGPQRIRATIALTTKNTKPTVARYKNWTSWEFVTANISCYQARPSEGSISSSSTKSSKTSSVTKYHSEPYLKSMT
nr:FMRFamide receptor [Biomphalaria glabrata]